MIKRIIIAHVLFLFSILPFIANAVISLPAIFGDNMVLQQKTDALIWGKADPGKSVKIQTSWNKKVYSTVADFEGKWRLKVETPEAGGPYSISISDGHVITINNVLIGEVWVCSGQSNMQMPMKGNLNQPILGSTETIATSASKYIRLFTVEKDKSLKQKDDFKGQWLNCIPENVANFSAVAYFFGCMTQKALDVPIGLICASWSGTRIEPWISERGFLKFNIELPSTQSLVDFSKQTPTVLFNAMIAPMTCFSIRGVLWYQGESNCNDPKEYEKLMNCFVEDWRNEWAIGNFPVYYVQIAPFDYANNGINSAFLREAQLMASVSIKNVGMVSLMDVGEKHNIHPANKKIVGQRLAYWALAKTYGMQGIECSGPVFKGMAVDGMLANLRFNYANNGLTTFGGKLKNFEIAGDDKKFFSAHAYITKDGVTVFSESVQKPVAVRYAFKDYLKGELFNTEGLPASSFRTDSWIK